MTFQGTTGWGNPVVSGSGELVIDNIHSRNYIAGVNGWSINRDGSAEFNDVLVRGELVARNGNAFVGLFPAQPNLQFNPDSTVYLTGALNFIEILGSGVETQLFGPRLSTQGVPTLHWFSNALSNGTFVIRSSELKMEQAVINTTGSVFTPTPEITDGLVIAAPVVAAGPWNTLPLNAGFQSSVANPGFGFIAEFRRMVDVSTGAGMLELRGTVAKTPVGTAFASGDIPFTLSTIRRPFARQFRPISSTSGAASAQTIRGEANENNGNFIVTWNTAAYAPTWICLDGYRIYLN